VAANASERVDETEERAEAGASSEQVAARRAGEPDYYAVLGVAPAATEDEIRHAFRRLAKLWHPDLYVSAPVEQRARAERRMRAVLRAYDALSTPTARFAYERRRAHQAADYARPHAAAQARYSSSTAAFYPTGAPGYSPAPHLADTTPAGGSATERSFAGVFGATLCGLIALALAGHVLRDGSADLGGGLSILGALVFAVLAALFLLDDAALARAANAYFEHAPRQTTARASFPHRQYQHHAGASDAVRRHRGRRHPPRRTPPAPQPPDVPEEPFEPQYVEPEREPTAFERLVDEALARVPEQFHPYLENVVVRVKNEPDDDELRRMKLQPCSLLLGLYEGVPVTWQGAREHPPQVITIFQRPIEVYCHGDPKRIRHQVRATVLHELAHHFGMDHDDMPAWIK
jgi:predicted Zn-dependent protease with MMP-like domain/curved DNA-binding protein CbpA